MRSPAIIPFHYTFCRAWSPSYQSAEGRAAGIAHMGQEALDETKRMDDGLIVDVPVVFGRHIVVSFYGGERIFTLQLSGGHMITGRITLQEVDSRVESHNWPDPDLSYKRDPKLADAMVDHLLKFFIPRGPAGMGSIGEVIEPILRERFR